MIDEYIVDYEDYVGLGSGAFSFLEGALYVNTFSLQAYGERIAEGKTAALQMRAFTKPDRMRYRFLMALFGMRLDKRQFAADFGVSIERGLAIEMAFMRSAGAFAVDNADELVLSSTGRYLLVAMMREFFVGVNNLRDACPRSADHAGARAALRRRRGRPAALRGEPAEPAAGVTAGMEDAESSPVPALAADSRRLVSATLGVVGVLMAAWTMRSHAGARDARGERLDGAVAAGRA